MAYSSCSTGPERSDGDTGLRGLLYERDRLKLILLSADGTVRRNAESKRFVGTDSWEILKAIYFWPF